MHVLGDVHGRLRDLKRICQGLRAQGDFRPIICVGDVGIGFPSIGPDPPLPDGFYMIAGNHDDREACKRGLSSYLGDYGVWGDTFFVGGAQSIDRHRRTPGVDWWAHEQLSFDERQAAIERYRQTKPRYVISHELPYCIHHDLYDAAKRRNPAIGQFPYPRPYPTSGMLDEMLDAHQPEKWFGGHWHVSWRQTHKGTRFVVLDELELVDAESAD